MKNISIHNSKRFLKRKSNMLDAMTLIFRYVFLITMCYVVVYPFFYMISSSFKTYTESLDPSIIWLPKTIVLDNYKNAISALSLPNSIYRTVFYEMVSAGIEVLSCSFVAYGLSRFEFRLKKILMVFLMLIIFVPPQMIIIPMVQNFANMDFFGIIKLIGYITGKEIVINTLDTVIPFYLPSILAVGLRSGIMIFIYIQFFKGLPKELEEAAWIDGAGPLKTYLRIALPSSGVVILTVSVFSMIWHWNDYYLSVMYCAQDYPLAVRLADIASRFDSLKIADAITQGNTSMAACFLYILPLLIVYMILQKKFTKSIDRVAITG